MPPTRKAATKAASKMTAKPSTSKTAAPAAGAPEQKRRGRPAKPKTTADEETTKTAKPAAKPRGRPKAVSAANTSVKRKRTAEVLDGEPPKKRGRPAGSKNAVAQSEEAVSATKSTVNKTAVLKVSKAASGRRKLIPKVPKQGQTPAKRGRPPKVRPSATNGKHTDVESDSDPMDQADEPCDQDAQTDLQYWLMKAEPDTRMENGIDVSYPIDKLAAATEPEPWDGVRNYVARNNMRAMRKGDLAFFYHSNCDVPGIVGVMRIAEEHSVDESAFDPAHPYYDEKSDRSKPKWDCVKVEFVKKFDNMVTLKTLKTTAELSEMQIASKSYSRLSVQAVKPDEWLFVLKMAGEDPAVGQDGKPTKVFKAGEPEGYEAGTDGETEKEIGAGDVNGAP